MFRGIPGLLFHVEIKLLDLLTSQRECELVSHNVIAANLQRRIDRVLEQGHELLEASAKLREEKLDLEVKLLSRLKELQKVSDFRRKVASAQLEVSSLQEQIDKDRTEKLALKHEVYLLKT